jgi:hypothetical protein
VPRGDSGLRGHLQKNTGGRPKEKLGLCAFDTALIKAQPALRITHHAAHIHVIHRPLLEPAKKQGLSVKVKHRHPIPTRGRLKKARVSQSRRLPRVLNCHPVGMLRKSDQGKQAKTRNQPRTKVHSGTPTLEILSGTHGLEQKPKPAPDASPAVGYSIRHGRHSPLALSLARIERSSSVVVSPVTALPQAISLSRRRMIFPLRVFGSASVMRTSSGFAIGPITCPT